MNGEREGHGIQTIGTEEEYDGEWIGDLRHGYGIMKYFDENQEICEAYEGDFFEGEIHGKGVYVYDNGDKYEGEF